MTEAYPERYPQDDDSAPEPDLPDAAFVTDAEPPQDQPDA